MFFLFFSLIFKEKYSSLKILSFFFQDFFGKMKIGHFFCPFFKRGERLCQKNTFLLHNEKLSSGDRKNNFQFVTIIFFYFF